MSLAQRITDLTTRIATEFKAVKTKLSGNNSGDISTLTTADKTSLLAAINEINAAQAAKIASSAIGSANGVAPLDATAKVPAAYLPGYVDDVLEFANRAAFPALGEAGKLYLAQDNGHIWRWTGSTYADITAASGAVSSVFGRTGSVTAQAGDYVASQVGNDSTVPGANLAAALDALLGSLASAVRFSVQVLSGAQQTQARANIDAASSTAIGDPDTNFVTVFEAALL